MTDHERTQARLDELIDAGLVEITTDDDGEQLLRLSKTGEELGRALAPGADFEPDTALARLLSQDEAQAGEIHRLETSANEPMTMRETFGTSLGSAMLGFEQALRRDPPAEVLAAEHVPERGYSGEGTPVVIEFPDDRMPGRADDHSPLALPADDPPPDDAG